MGTVTVKESAMRKVGLISGSLLLVGVSLSFVAGTSSCSKVECGQGTIEFDGVCVTGAPGGDGGFTQAQCDPNVSKFEGGRCVPKLPPIICETGNVLVDDGGIGHCTAMMGTDCNVEAACQDPSGTGGDEICVSGRVLEGDEHSKQIPMGDPRLNEIEVRVYEPLNFLADPTSAPFRRLSLGNGLDTCGRFTVRFSTSQDTPNGLVAFSATDKMGTATPKYVLGATASRPQPNTNIRGKAVYLVSKALDSSWSTAAGVPGGKTFSELGTLAVRYHLKDTDATEGAIPGVAVAGIVPAWNNAMNPATDYFFSDADVADGTNLKMPATAQTKTGPNGVAFVTIGPGLGNIFLAGGAGSCTKAGGAAGTATVDTTNTLAGSAVGVIFFFDLQVKCD